MSLPLHAPPCKPLCTHPSLTSASSAADAPGAIVTSKPTGDGGNVAGLCSFCVSSRTQPTMGGWPCRECAHSTQTTAQHVSRAALVACSLWSAFAPSPVWMDGPAARTAHKARVTLGNPRRCGGLCRLSHPAHHGLWSCSDCVHTKQSTACQTSNTAAVAHGRQTVPAGWEAAAALVECC